MSDKKFAKVLIVEDSAIDRENYRRLLSRNREYDFEIRECDSGAAAMEAFRQDRPDCILLDYNLPDVDGIEFLSAMQAEGPHYALPLVLMLTGQGTSNVAVESLRRGATDYLVKNSIDSDTLNLAINKALANVVTVLEQPVRKSTVLIVDHNPHERRIYQRLLRESTRSAFLFSEVGSGAEGIAEFLRSEPDCILLEYQLPDFDGLVFLSKLAEIQTKANQPMPVVVMLSRHASETIAVEAMKRGAMDYLLKDELTRETLHRSVAVAIEKQSLIARLKEKEREFAHFSYAVAHDLQAPLRRTRSFCTLLVESASQSLQGDEKLYLDLIDQNVAALQQMIHDLLGYYSIDHVNESKSNVDMQAVVQQAMENLSDYLTERHAQVDILELPPIFGFRSLLVLLFQNLIQNGIKFNRNSVPHIQIDAVISAKYVQYRVRDNGISIDAQQMKRVFKPFERLHTQDEYGGSGLGLAICEKAVKMHDGRIWFDAAQGGGTVFHIRLPKWERL